MNSSPKQILVADDEPKIVEFIESYLTNSGYQVHKAGTGKQVLEVFFSQKIDLILLDLMLPDISGEEICQKIRKVSKVPIIMLTAKISEESIIHGLNIGADDYMTKPFSPRQMVARVNAVFRRVSMEPGDTNILSFQNGNFVINLTEHVVKKNGQEISLTPKEFNILTVLAGYPNKVFTRDELIQAAFEGDYDGYDRTIDSHIKNLRGKIEDNPKESSYVVTIRGIGYKFGGD